MTRLETLIELKILNSSFLSFYYNRLAVARRRRQRRRQRRSRGQRRSSEGITDGIGTPDPNTKKLSVSDIIQSLLHLSRLVIWGSSWGRAAPKQRRYQGKQLHTGDDNSNDLHNSSSSNDHSNNVNDSMHSSSNKHSNRSRGGIGEGEFIYIYIYIYMYTYVFMHIYIYI